MHVNPVPVPSGTGGMPGEWRPAQPGLYPVLASSARSGWNLLFLGFDTALPQHLLQHVLLTVVLKGSHGGLLFLSMRFFISLLPALLLQALCTG
jgi:hypothetical protein